MNFESSASLSKAQLGLLQSMSNAAMEGGIWIDRSKTVDTLAIGCMDDRFWSLFTGLQKNGTTIALRNGGAMVSEMIGEIDLILQQFPTISSINVYTHEDCGAMGYCYKVLTGQVEATTELDKRVVSHMKKRLESVQELTDIASIDLKDLERYNSEFKKSILDAYFAGRVNVPDAELIKKGELALRPEWHAPNDHKDAVILFTPPTNVFTPEQISVMGHGEEKKRAYQVKRTTLFNALPDIALAHQLGIPELRILSFGYDDDERVRNRVVTLRRLAKDDKDKAFLKDMKLSPVYFEEGLKRLQRYEGIPANDQVRRLLHSK